MMNNSTAPSPYTTRLARPTLYLSANDAYSLLTTLGPALGLWRAAEVAALRAQRFERPILDLVCGDGAVMSRVLQHIDVGVEPNRHLLTRAAETGVYSRLEQRPAEATNLPDASVATIVSNSVLEHMRHVGMVLTEIARVLQPGGTFMFTTPTSHFSSMLLLPLPGYVVWRNREMYNVNLWPITQWIDALHASGFKVEQVQPYLRPELVRLWDTLEILHQIWVRRRRLLGIMWRRIPPRGVARLAERLSQTNLAAPTTAGGQLIVARRQLEGSHGSIYSL